MVSDIASTSIANRATKIANLNIEAPSTQIDFATILGLLVSFSLIIGAIIIGQSNANFINMPAFMIVIFGTMAATSVSYSGEELRAFPGIVRKTIMRQVRDPSKLAIQLLIIATEARKRGILSLSAADKELQADPYLHKSVLLVTDGYSADEIDEIMQQEISSLAERHKRSASILKRAADIAPAMGLIGTLVGLVQMLAQLDDPASIGPAMAVALLTTFYGAIMGTIVLSPLSAKLERNSSDEILSKSIILTAMGSIVRQENPRRLEMILNSILPPEKRIKFFK